jgi:hypothetical protein
MKTTARDFALFGKVALATAAKLGLDEWEFRFGHEQKDGLLAWTSYQCPDRIASLFLAREWKHDPITRDAITRAAKHEVIHILLADMSVLARRDSSALMVDQAEHAVVQRLMRLV